VIIVLKKTLSIILISRWLIAIFVISVAGVAVTPFETEIHKTRIIVGTIINKNIGLVTVGSQERPGQILTLSTNSKTDRLALRPGDHIIVEYSPDYIIRSITKQG
jgi:mRNA degradation ribonuclease J1/J2